MTEIKKPVSKLHVSDRERGTIILLFAAAFSTIMMLFALMVDFGGAAMTYHKAQIAVDAAAFSAAQGININHFYATNKVELHQGQAAGLAGQFASLNSSPNAGVTITGVYANKDRVWVTGTASYRSLFAHYLGLGSFQIKVTSSATPAFGIVERGE